MPNQLELRLKTCDEKIDALFYGIELNEIVEAQLKSLKAYYRKLYMDASDRDEEEYVKMYEFLVQGFEGVKNGQLKSEDVLKGFEEIKSLRKWDVILENIFTALELLFWATAACAFFIGCVIIASPTSTINPFLTIAALTVGCTWAINCIVNFFECIDEFKSLDPVEEEYKREKDLISFFKPTETSTKSKDTEPDVSESKKQQPPLKDEEKLYPEISPLTC